MSEPTTAAPPPPPDRKPPGRLKQSHLDSTEAVDDWLKGNGRLVFGAIAIIMVLGFVYFAFFA